MTSYARPANRRRLKGSSQRSHGVVNGCRGVTCSKEKADCRAGGARRLVEDRPDSLAEEVPVQRRSVHAPEGGDALHGEERFVGWKSKARQTVAESPGEPRQPEAQCIAAEPIRRECPLSSVQIRERRRAAVDSGLARRLEARDQSRASPDHGDRNAEALGERTHQEDLRSSGVVRPKRSSASAAVGSSFAGLLAQDAKGLRVVENEQSRELAQALEILPNGCRALAARAETIGHDQRAKARLGISLQPPSKLGRIVVAKPPYADAPPGCPLHAPACDRVGTRVDVDRRVRACEDHEQVPEGVQGRARERHALGPRQPGETFGDGSCQRWCDQSGRRAGSELGPRPQTRARVPQAQVERRGKVEHVVTGLTGAPFSAVLAAAAPLSAAPADGAAREPPVASRPLAP